MNKLTSMIMIFALSSMVFAAATHANKAPVKMSKKYNARIEPTENVISSTGQSSPILLDDNRNSFTFDFIDESKNGYGMITSPTNPLFVSSEGLFFVYRQWAGDAGTSGQIGASFTADGIGSSWTTYYNLNGEYEIGRYPSAVGTEDYPYAVWNEYTGTGNPSYGGRPFYTYDEFGWDGGSFADPIQTDLTWDEGKDLWVGSPVVSTDDDEVFFNVAYADWTRNDCWLFHSEAYEDGYVIFGSEIKVLNETADFVGGDEEGSYTSSPVVDINDDGIGYFAASAYFSGADVNASVVPDGSYHTAIFRMTTDHGATWLPAHGIGAQTEDKYYYIDDAVIDHMFDNGVFPTSWTDPDGCPDSEDMAFTEIFMAYDFDIKVDSDGNPHFIMGLLPGDGEYVMPWADESGYFHFTIDKNHLDAPGLPQTPTGWNYSFVASTSDTWAWDDDAGLSYWQIAFPTMALGPDGNMFVVSSMITEGLEFDPDEDPCTYDSEYPEWSNDVYVMKSEDNGANWWCPYNASATPDPDPTDIDSPEEISAHAGSSADADGVYLNYQMPDYLYGSTTGDAGDADMKQRVYVAYAELTSQPDCGGEAQCNALGDANGDGGVDILDIVTIVNHILGVSLLEDPLALCGADMNEDGGVDILDIVTIVNCILGTGSCGDDTSARISTKENQSFASLINKELQTNGAIGGIQFDGILVSELEGNDIVQSANGKTIIYNSIDGILNTSSFVFDVKPENLIVASSMGQNVEVTIASDYALLDSYPNPFNPQTTISYQINTNDNVNLSIYNMLGQQVSLLVNDFVESGDYNVVWNGMDFNGNEVSSGIYIVKLETANQVISNKITLLR